MNIYPPVRLAHEVENEGTVQYEVVGGRHAGTDTKKNRVLLQLILLVLTYPSISETLRYKKY